MKKTIGILAILMYFVTISVCAQEVRGIETKRVVYDGKRDYSYYAGNGYDNHSTKYYGWEFKNFNSCSVSVDITMYKQATTYYGEPIPAKVIATKTIVLRSGESYVFKNEFSGTEAIASYGYEKTEVNDYYVEYKAFKLQ